MIVERIGASSSKSIVMMTDVFTLILTSTASSATSACHPESELIRDETGCRKF